MPDDEDLRDRFTKLRAEDHARAGEFYSFLRRADPRPIGARLSPWIAMGALLTMMIVAVVTTIEQSGRRGPQGPPLSITQWKSSTDFLLQTPGREILRSVPRIGEWPAYTEGPQGSRKSPAEGKKIRKSLTELFNEEH